MLFILLCTRSLLKMDVLAYIGAAIGALLFFVGAYKYNKNKTKGKDKDVGDGKYGKLYSNQI